MTDPIGLKTSGRFCWPARIPRATTNKNARRPTLLIDAAIDASGRLSGRVWREPAW